MEYTKGEWVIRERNFNFEIHLVKYQVAGGISSKANANLMASAPDLYEALKAIEYVIQVDKSELSNHPIATQMIRDAIAKAEGKDG